MMRKTFSLWSLFCCILLLHAQAPDGYYNLASGKKGAALKTALYAIITNHTARSYNDLWTDFRTTDVRDDGKVWDMYSNATNYTFGVEQGKNYKTEGDSYNREHSFPKSWFNDAKPMYTDLFHLFPTDGYVNGRRSNYPYGETNNPTWTSSGGFSKLGPSSTPGYSGTVFEPNDEYKGDFARAYFYMATCYEDRISTWDSPMLAGNAYPAYADWAVAMLLRWAAEDPVSQKEIDRNNAVYGIQRNRNPYVDYPGLEQYVWGDKKTVAFDPDNYDGGGDAPDPGTEVAAPAFSPAPGQVEIGTEVTISCATEGAYIYYALNDGEEQVAYPPVSFTVNGNTTVTAHAQLGSNASQTVVAAYTVPGATLEGENVFTLVESEDGLEAGMHCLIVCETKGTALGAQQSDIRTYAEVEIADGKVTTPVNEAGLPYALRLGGQPGSWTFYDGVGNYFLALTSSANKLHYADSGSDASAQWSISIGSGGTAEISSVAYPDRSIQYNASSPRFACYKSSQQKVSIYARKQLTGVAGSPLLAGGKVTVYSLDGTLVRRDVPAAEALRGLPRGIYVVGGTKFLVR